MPWYGQVKRVYKDAPGVDAFSLADKIKAPVLGLYGEAEFMLYPGAPHAFFSDDRPQVYKKDAAEDARRRCLAFFDKYLKASERDGCTPDLPRRAAS